MNEIQIVYLILAIIWILIIIIFKLYQTDIIGWLIILIPFVVFAICSYHATNDENSNANPNANILADNTLSIGILLLIPLIAFADKSYHEEPAYRNRFIGISVLAISLYLLSYIVFWVPQRYINIVNRVVAGLVTMSVALMIYVLYLYYQHRSKRKIEIPDEIAKHYDSMSLSY